MSEPSATPCIDELRGALPPDMLRSAAAIEPRYLGDWVVRADAEDAPVALTLPRTTADVVTILEVCHAHGVPVVPQGGLTGLTGAATPVEGAVLISLERMRAILEVDPVASTMTVEAGATLQAVQEAADAAGLLYPLDIGGPRLMCDRRQHLDQCRGQPRAALRHDARSRARPRGRARRRDDPDVPQQNAEEQHRL